MICWRGLVGVQCGTCLKNGVGVHQGSSLGLEWNDRRSFSGLAFRLTRVAKRESVKELQRQYGRGSVGHLLGSLSVGADFLLLRTVKPVGILILPVKTLRLRDGK